MCKDCIADPGFRDHIRAKITEAFNDKDASFTQGHALWAPVALALQLIRDDSDLTTAEERTPILQALVVLLKDLLGGDVDDDSEEEVIRVVGPNSDRIGELLQEFEDKVIADPEGYADIMNKYATRIGEHARGLYLRGLQGSVHQKNVLQSDKTPVEDMTEMPEMQLMSKLLRSVQHVVTWHQLNHRIMFTLMEHDSDPGVAQLVSASAHSYLENALRQLPITEAVIITDEHKFIELMSSVMGTMAVEWWMAGVYAGSGAQDCPLGATHEMGHVGRFATLTDEQHEEVIAALKNYYS